MNIKRFSFGNIIFVFFLLIVCCQVSNAQNTIELLFTGVDQHNNYVKINSIAIENLTRGWSETILFPDTVFTLEMGVGVEDYRQEGTMQVMPNPFDGRTRVNIPSFQNETVTMFLADINGKKCATFTGVLTRGDNIFEISLTTPQVYVLSVITPSGTRSLKMVNRGHAGTDRIRAESNTGKSAKVDLKSTSTHDFELGDEMRYTGHTSVNGITLQSSVVTQTQYISENITLVFDVASGSTHVTTDSIQLHSDGTLSCYGSVQSGQPILDRGFCYSTAHYPTIDDYRIQSGTGTGAFNSTITDLDPSLIWHIRAYATTAATTIYGAEYTLMVKINYTNTDTMFIPDGVACDGNCGRNSYINITNQPAGSTIQSIEDIRYFRLKMEHSWIGDLWISLSCPNQQSVTILKKNASSINGNCASAIPATALGWSTTDASHAHFGLYYEPDGYGHCNGDGSPIGECWNYCWSNAATQGYQYACGQGLVYESCNHLDNVDNPHGGASGSSSSNYVDSTNMATMTNVYHPDESFANLIGCPLNGIWSIQVVDAWASDNGYICEWELALNPNTPVFLSETEVSETPCPQAASVTDYDGNVYGTVAIGSQCWMRENLRTTHTASGTAIIPGNGTDAGTAHYYLPSASDSSGIYGHLYNWKAAENVCPDGWHLPSDSEWAQLTDFLGSLDTCVCGDNPNNVARAMASDTFWSPSSTPCAVGSDLSLNNISNFSTLPVGYTNGTPTAFGTTARFWTATSYNNDYAYYRSLYHDNGFVERNPYGDKAHGMSVRCILAKTPKVTTAAVTNVTDSTAVCGGEVTSIGGAPMTERGLCWSTHAYPTIGDNLVACGAGLGTFTGQMTGLIPGTTYYVRAYATNAAGTVYGASRTFSTLTIPTVTTQNVGNIWDSTATCGGNISYDGGSPVTTRGVCWGTAPNPTIADNHTSDGSGIGTFSSQLTGLVPGTDYNVRAYAINSIGIAYGEQKSFTTKSAPTITLNQATNILSLTASCTYYINSNGQMTITNRGICYSTTPNPTLNDSVIAGTANTGTLQLSGLTPGTTYYVRAYATNAIGTSYSAQISFTTQTIPTLTTAAVSDIDFFTATGGGEVLNTGVPAITARGVCWNTSPNPTIANSHTSDSTGFGTFVSQLTGLTIHTTYYVRAYATNSSGTGYGEQVTFTTLNIPTVTTKNVTNILDSTATCGGSLTSNGDGTLLATGICWSTAMSPTINDFVATDTSLQSNFTCTMTGLIPNTTYYVRAFATNGGGTAYGPQRNFTTKSLPTITLDSATNITSHTASCTYHVTFAGNMAVTARGICYSTTPNPTLQDSVIAGTSSNGTIQLTGLTASTTYYVRAYATNGIGTSYSNLISFTTLSIPTLTTAAVTDIDFFTATSGGEVLNTGVPAITARGVCWSTSSQPTIDDNHTSDSTGFGVFTSHLTGLVPNTTYYVRAYAINSAGINYGNQIVFATPRTPTVSTKTINNITDSSATCGGNVTSNGGAMLLATGVCWSTSQNPTINDFVVTDSTAQPNFTCVMTGLVPNTQYYVRAFATNGGGTSYGVQRSFITRAIPTIALDTITNIQSLSASCSYHLVYNGGVNVSDRGICYSTTPNPTLNDSVIASTANTGTLQLSGLIPGTTYYVRAYATNNFGTGYSNQISFTTLTIPTVITTPISDVSFFTATGGGEVLATGVPAITARGVCWSTEPYPTIADSLTSDSTGFGTFTSHLTGLTPGTTYHVRAYAINNSGISYGEDLTFTTVSVKTELITQYTDTTALAGGSLTPINGSTTANFGVSDWGICWSTTPNPSVHNNIILSTGTLTHFTCNMTNLTSGNAYCVRAFVTINGDTLYGNEVSFTTKEAGIQSCPGVATVTDIDGNTYNTVKIGDQCWTKENMRATRYSDGISIPLGNTSSGTPYHRYYPNDSIINVPVYGYMYDWPTTMHGGISTNATPIQGVCPNGWHVPSHAEWSSMEQYVSNHNTFTCNNSTPCTAKALASKRGWIGCWFCTSEENNTSGFSAFPAGIDNRVFGESAYFWTSSSDEYGWEARCHYIYYESCSIDNFTNNTNYGRSVRCIYGTGYNIPVVKTASVSSLGYSSVACGGEITSNGGASVTQRGVCWSTQPNPSIDFNNNITVNGNGSGSFSSNVTGLTPGTTYYMRAYATNSAGTAYGQQVTFTTLNIPVITTKPVTNILDSTAVCGGVITFVGDGPIMAKGVCWKTSVNPTVNDHITTDTSAQADFNCLLTELTPGTRYYVRAFATNAGGTVYGAQESFYTSDVKPTVSTDMVYDITTNSAIGGGHIVSTGLSNITAQGVCWSTSSNPTIADNHTSDSIGTSVFSSNITGLVTGTLYHIRAYATNSSGTGYGEDVAFFTLGNPSQDNQPCPNTPTLTDFDGNTYNTVKIGQQCWMKENLRTTHYANGTAIPSGTTSSTTSPYYYYNSSSGIALAQRGYLYNWAAAMHGENSSDAIPSGVQGICPTGWHLPSSSEWRQLNTYVGAQSQYLCNGNSRYIAKALASTTGWNEHYDDCTVGNILMNNNATGFSAMPVGYYTSNGNHSVGIFTAFWSSTNSSSDYTNILSMSSMSPYSAIGTDRSDYYYSVRCLQNGSISGLTIPTITTNSVSNVIPTSAQCGGDVICHDEVPITAKGICWSTAHNPTTDDNHTSDGSGAGSFGSSMTGLTPGVTYYVRAYAVSDALTAYGNEISFTTLADGIPCVGVETVTDIDSNVYNTVQIGQQCWMKENLRTTHYPDGELIPIGGTSQDMYPTRYAPDNNIANVPAYGYLYSWSATMHGAASSNSNPSGVQGICPDGWHVPSHAEWLQLFNYVSNQSGYMCSKNNGSSSYAKALAAPTGWLDYDYNTDTWPDACSPGWRQQGSNNATGFSAMPAGYHQMHIYGSFGRFGNYWSSTQSSANQCHAYFWGWSLDTVCITTFTFFDSLGVSRSSSVRCIRNANWLPSVSTNPVSCNTSNKAFISGNISNEGSASVTARGVCWSTSHNPTISDSHTSDGTGTGSFSTTITGLQPSTTYYARAYATNHYGTEYGDEMSFTTLASTNTIPDGQPCPCSATVTDIDSNTYNTVKIGNQCWMKENLRVLHYANGENIPTGTQGSYTVSYYYDYPSGFALEDRGYLYNWAAVMHGVNSSTANPSGVQGVCPTGWHVPSEAEWDQLTSYMGQGQYACGNSSLYFAKALATTTGWNTSTVTCAVGNTPSTNNASGFSAFPAGLWYNGSTSNTSVFATFWTSTEDDNNQAKRKILLNSSVSMSGGGIHDKRYGMSVRCLQD
ncbi:MAG: fibrobacter succinogenes major paralogous domain-containing protein [Bacteroidales bacterium]|nr:fibrobacter succinogenes major paralogous domain-containing protein [Bacteroidales bacterium]